MAQTAASTIALLSFLGYHMYVLFFSRRDLIIQLIMVFNGDHFHLFPLLGTCTFTHGEAAERFQDGRGFWWVRFLGGRTYISEVFFFWCVSVLQLKLNMCSWRKTIFVIAISLFSLSGGKQYCKVSTLRNKVPRANVCYDLWLCKYHWIELNKEVYLQYTSTLYNLNVGLNNLIFSYNFTMFNDFEVKHSFSGLTGV